MVNTEAPRGGHSSPRTIPDIYEELGFAFLKQGEKLKAEGESASAESRYAEATQAFKSAVREGGDFSRIGPALARSQELEGRSEDSLRTYLQAAVANPASSVEILQKANECLTPPLAQSIGDWLGSEWLAAMSQAGLDLSQRADVFRLVGRASLYRRDYPAALENYRIARGAQPDDPFILEGLGESLWRIGQTAEAVPVLRDAVRQADRAVRDGRSAIARLKLGGALTDLGRHREAIGTLRQGIALGGEREAQLWTALARARLELGRSEGALRATERAIELDQKLAEPPAVRAAADFLEQRRYKEASEAAEKALDIDPGDMVATRVKGRALIDGAIDIDQGIRLIQRHVDRSPRDIEYRLLLARTMRSAGRPPSEVIDVLKKGMVDENADKPPTLYLDLAEVYRDAGDPSLALAVLDLPAAKGEGEDLTRWWRVRGDLLRAQGNTESALEAYAHAVALSQQAAEADKWNGVLKVNLALAARGAGDNERAWSAVNEAIETALDADVRTKAFALLVELVDAVRRPREEILKAYYEAGRHFNDEGDSERALDWLGRLIELDPTYKDARWYRVDALRTKAIQPAFPYFSEDLVAEARCGWLDTLSFGTPGRDHAWAYISGALILDAEAQLSPTQRRAAQIWEGVAYIERSLLLDDSNIYAWLYLSRFHRAVGNYVNALIASERALQIDPNSLEAMDERFGGLADRGDAKAARELIDKRLKRQRTSWVEGVSAFVLYLEDNLHAALEQISRVIDSDPDDIWSLSLRGDLLRLISLSEKGAGNHRERAVEDYRRILERRGDNSYLAYDTTFAGAAYGVGDVQLTVEILEPLLGNSLDPSCDHFRTLGCCHLRLGDLLKAEEYLNRGIDHANTSTQLKSLDSLLLAEIERDSVDWTNRELVLALLERARARIVAAQRRIESQFSEEMELRRVRDWEQATEQTRGWSSIGANAGLARIALGADQLEQAAAIYRTLVPDTERFPEASLGIAKVGARYGELGKETLIRGWDELDVTENATKMFERALALEQTLSATERGELLVGKALSQFQVGAVESASDTFASAVEAFEADSLAKPGLKLGEMCRAFLPDVPHFWALDSYFRHLALRQSAPQPLLSVLPEVVESLGGYLETVLDPRETPVTPGVTPIALEISANLAPEEGKEDDWPLLKKWIPEMRERIEDETGVRVPGVRIRGNIDLPHDTYVIVWDEVPLVMGRVVSSAKYSPSPASALEAAGVPVSELEESIHPLSKQTGWWISPEYWDSAKEAKECSLWPDPMQFVVAHLEAVLRSNLADLLGLQEVLNLLERWSRIKLGRELIESVLPDIAAREHFGRVLRAVVQERVPITDWERILVAVRDARLGGDDVGNGVRRVRLATRADLPGNKLGSRFLVLPIEIEQAITPAITTADGRRFLAMTPEATQEILAGIRELVQLDDPATVLVIESADVRYFLRRLVEIEFPSILFQSREETLTEEDRKGPDAWVPLIAEWGDLWPQNEEAHHAE